MGALAVRGNDDTGPNAVQIGASHQARHPQRLIVGMRRDDNEPVYAFQDEFADLRPSG
ncbi:MAG TPA: hypothetical protein VIJ18_05095 [Microbacteriaceae bacterium]